MLASRTNSLRRRVLVAVFISATAWGPATLGRQNSPAEEKVVVAPRAATNQAPPNSYAVPVGVPIKSPVKRKAGLLAGTGLAVIALLALAAGLALVRAFKR
jgi:hypothetical protein